MAFLGRCYGCRDDNHGEHTAHFDTPPADSFICGGGTCVCSVCTEMGHLDERKPSI